MKNEIENLDRINNIYDNIFDNNDYLEYDNVYSKLNKIYPSKLEFKLNYIFSYFLYQKYENLYYVVKYRLDNIKNSVDKHNDIVIKNEIANFKNICGKVEEKELDNQQIDSIIRKNRNQLVIAGAGSGKTTTIVGKVKYLLKTNQAKPEDILLLSFTNASASEMKERIKKETNEDLDVFTFHKLGLEIIKNSTNNNIKIFDGSLYNLIKELINSNLSNDDYLKKLIYFMSVARFNAKDEFDFTSEEEYEEYLSSNKPTTIKGEIVKSYGELEIANYLFSHNIDYIYEKEYEYNTKTNEYRQYTPDFYLPKYGIYIEYFGIDKNGNVAPFFKSKSGISASEIYFDSMEWKRKLHKKNNTKMIETFYYEKKENKLIEKLEEKLITNNVEIIPKSNEEIWNSVNKNNTGLLSEICRVFETIINLIKSNNYDIDLLYNLDIVQQLPLNILTLDLIKPIYEKYEQKLSSENMIDFNDMINMATTCVNNNKYIHNYKYVIVDEYQDMSVARYNLLSSLRNQNDFKLFCVGDDWQSIYRFNGSDISLITNFEGYWGKTYISFIERTYRFTSMMSVLSSNFIMRNPMQYKKRINAKISDELALEFIKGYTEKNCINFLSDKLLGLDKDSTIYFLGRYSFDIDILKDNIDYSVRYNVTENVVDITFKKRNDLKIKFMTIHKSKGLQADYIVILNNKNYGMGFPSKINDLPLVNILLGCGIEDYKYSEERRLFYVALTRSKRKTFLLTIDNNKSCFIEELEQDYYSLMRTDVNLKKNIYKCPECGGRTIIKNGPYGKFIGCSNYPKCKYTRKIRGKYE